MRAWRPSCRIRGSCRTVFSSNSLHPLPTLSASAPALGQTRFTPHLWTESVSCLLQVFFQATSPSYVTLIKSRCNRMFDRRGQMAFEKKSTSVCMTQHSFPVRAQPSKALCCWPWVGACRETHNCSFRTVGGALPRAARFKLSVM